MSVKFVVRALGGSYGQVECTNLDDALGARKYFLDQSIPPEEITTERIETIDLDYATVQPFTSVFVYGGIIEKTELNDDLVYLVKRMREELADNFDRDSDDARIFNAEGKEVYSYTEEDNFEEKEAEFFNPTEQAVSVIPKESALPDYVLVYDPEGEMNDEE